MTVDAFSTYHPVITFAYFICVIVFGMCFGHPVFCVAACAASLLYYVIIMQRSAISILLLLLALFCVISVLNPFFVPYGDTVLFTYFDGRPYTFEALVYGTVTSSMLVSMLLWFGCYNHVMTSDKFLCLFGNIIPSISVTLTMILRLVPNYQRKAHELHAARKALGKASGGVSRTEQIKEAFTELGTLVNWAFEHGLTMADSMKSRGHGSGKRTAYSVYRFETRDKVLLAIMIVLAACAAIGGFSAASGVSFYPTIDIPALDAVSLGGFSCYCVLLVIPSFVNLKEFLTWRISLLNS